MTSPNARPIEIGRQLLDGDTLERLLAGRLEPDDAPPGYAEVARVLRAAAARFDPADLGREAEHVAAARMLITQPSPASARFDRRSQGMRSKGHRLRVVGLVVLGTLLGTSGLAAAGVLPDTAQAMMSSVLDRVGISVPSGDDLDGSGEPNRHPASSEGQSKHPASSGAQISEIATTTDSTAVGKGAEISSIASGGVSRAGEHGSAEHGTAEHGSAGHGTDAAPDSSPNAGGTSTADAASGGRSQAGADIADERSNGRSAGGSRPPSQPPSHGSPH